MVTSATSLTRSGLTDFIVQRVTAVILGVYTLWVLYFFLSAPVIDHAALTTFFGSTFARLFSTLAILSTAAHAWIGLWTVGTDYLLPAHIGGMATRIRFVYQMLCVLAIFVYVAWGLALFWS